MAVTLIVGAQWGDEGKAKVIDYLSENIDIVVRYQGGANAGHTVVVNGEKYIFHLIPSGILYPNTICVLGGGMVIDPEAFFLELSNLKEKNIDIEGRIRIADNAHILLPYHSLIDRLREESESITKIGTTKRGIGVCYADKVNRTGIRIGDLVEENFYKNRLPRIIQEKNILLKEIYKDKEIKVSQVEDLLRELGQKLKQYLINAPYYLNMEITSGKRVLLEGAQGTMLDVDFGTYPYVTSSNPTIGGALIGSGINYRFITESIGIMKAYATRVGEGPFPTEAFGEDSEKLQKMGNEFGSTTGRPRRCGWFDVEVIKHAARINGLTGLVLTKLDVLDEFDKIKIAVGYELDGKRISYFPSCAVERIKVIYEEMPGWKESITHCKKFSDLPKNTRKYIEAVEKFCGVPVKWVSVGPDRENTIKLK
ncbi:MAG: adenylosuccinate synthase [Spirochaetia bacterium]|nr:adenylosuccinate synthase [Spirochaetia bacterium]